MKPVKQSVAVVVRDRDGAFLVVKRPDDPADPLAGMWGFPAITRRDGEDERDAVVRAGRVKLGVELTVGPRLGVRSAERDAYVLTLADYSATVADGTVSVPQSDTSMTQYTQARFTDDPGILRAAADRGSLCARIFLQSSERP